MRTTLMLLLLSISVRTIQAQQSPNEYNFWVGHWKVSWVTSKGDTITGSNFIEKTVDEKVLQEHFNDPSTGFKGTSISVYNPTKQVWHQAWADNQGGYYNFIGETQGDKKIFKTLPVTKNKQTIIQRMVFFNITPNAFTWDWESSTNGGQTWTLNWRIAYTRKQEK